MEPPITGHDAVSHKMTVRMNWREEAACGGTDPDLFFPIGTIGNALRQIEEAKHVTKQGTENVEYISSLPRQKQPRT